MAFRITIAKRLYKHHSPAIGIIGFHHHLLTSPENSSDAGFLHQRHIIQSPKFSLPELFYLPVGENLNISSSDCLRRERLTENLNSPSFTDSVGLSVGDARKIIKCWQLQNVRSVLKEIKMNSITYDKFVTICSDVCNNHEQGIEFAKLLDVAGDVVVLGNVVFLHPDQVAKSMEKLISQSIAIPNDQRKHELEELEKQKALIDQKAISQVRSELYCGLGFVIVQMLCFMRLTFWELSWDVMEPICFFVTSFHFTLAYMFFLRTSKEPTFECYFQRRFQLKQRKLMDLYKFDYNKYNELCKAFYPNYQCNLINELRSSKVI